MVSDYSSNVSEPDLSYTKKAFQNNHSLGGNSTTAETINDIFAQIEQTVFWFKLKVYFVLSICIVWLIGLVKRNLGLDTQSIKLRRIRCILEDPSSNK